MTQTQQPTSAQIVTGSMQRLNALLAQKETLTEQLEAVSTEIKALRNLAQGIELGQKLAAEVAAEQARNTPAK